MHACKFLAFSSSVLYFATALQYQKLNYQTKKTGKKTTEIS
jgi:hypothetical protein